MAIREERLRAAETEVARRRSELGAVELKREAVEQRERAVADLEGRIAARERELTERGRPLESVVELAFVPGVAYRLSEIEPAPLTAGSTFDVEGVDYLVARVGPSPLPADARRCAYLMERHAWGQAEADPSPVEA